MKQNDINAVVYMITLGQSYGIQYTVWQHSSHQPKNTTVVSNFWLKCLTFQTTDILTNICMSKDTDTNKSLKYLQDISQHLTQLILRMSAHDWEIFCTGHMELLVTFIYTLMMQRYLSIYKH